METQTLQRTLSSLLRGCRVRQRGPSTFEMQRCAISGHKAECHASDLAKCCSDSHRLPQTKPGRRFPEVQGRRCRSLSLARELPESPRPGPSQGSADTSKDFPSGHPAPPRLCSARHAAKPSPERRGQGPPGLSKLRSCAHTSTATICHRSQAPAQGPQPKPKAQPGHGLRHTDTLYALRPPQSVRQAPHHGQCLPTIRHMADASKSDVSRAFRVEMMCPSSNHPRPPEATPCCDAVGRGRWMAGC